MINSFLAGLGPGLTQGLESAQRRRAMDLALQEERRKKAVAELIGSPDLSFAGLGANNPLAQPQPTPAPGGAGPGAPPQPQLPSQAEEDAVERQMDAGARPQWMPNRPQAPAAQPFIASQTPMPDGGVSTTIPPAPPRRSTQSLGFPSAAAAEQPRPAPQVAGTGAPAPEQGDSSDDAAANLAAVAANPQAPPQAVQQATHAHMQSFPDPLEMLDTLRSRLRAAAPPGTDPAVIGDATMKLFGMVNTGNLQAMRLYAQMMGLQGRTEDRELRREIATGNVGGQSTVAKQRADTSADLGRARVAQGDKRLQQGQTRIDLQRERMVEQKAERLFKSADKATAQQARAIMAQRRTILDRAKQTAGMPSPEDAAALEKLDKQIEELEAGRAKALGVNQPKPVE